PGDGASHGLDPRLHRHPLLVAHQALVRGLARRVRGLRDAAADLGALRLSERWQPGNARSREGPRVRHDHPRRRRHHRRNPGGGRARCTTCRIQVSRGLETLPPPEELEAKALARIAAPAGMRLACQVRPTADISVTPLLAADASAADGYVPGGLEGSERLITVMFVDLR